MKKLLKNQLKRNKNHKMLNSKIKNNNNNNNNKNIKMIIKKEQKI